MNSHPNSASVRRSDAESMRHQTPMLREAARGARAHWGVAASGSGSAERRSSLVAGTVPPADVGADHEGAVDRETFLQLLRALSQVVVLDTVAATSLPEWAARGERELRVLLADDPERAHVELTVRSLLAEGVEPGSRAGVRAVRTEVATARGRYSLRCVQLPSGVAHWREVTVVLVERGLGDGPTVADVRARFGLTIRESEVALLLARRCSNAEIAQALGISPHTARHHTERVLQRLGLCSRVAVSGLLKAALRPTEPMEP